MSVLYTFPCTDDKIIGIKIGSSTAVELSLKSFYVLYWEFRPHTWGHILFLICCIFMLEIIPLILYESIENGTLWILTVFCLMKYSDLFFNFSYDFLLSSSLNFSLNWELVARISSFVNSLVFSPSTMSGQWCGGWG